MKTLEWWVHSNEGFEGEYDWLLKKETIWQQLMIEFGCDTIPALPYNHNTWNWVGLNWKFMYLSMGSLWTSAIGVMPRLSPLKNELKWRSYLKRLCSSRDGGLPLLGGQVHRRGAYTRVCNWKVMVDDPHTEYDNLGLVTPDGRIKCCGESVPPLQSVKLFE